jgi:hypothetical protein
MHDAYVDQLDELLLSDWTPWEKGAAEGRADAARQALELASAYLGTGVSLPPASPTPRPRTGFFLGDRWLFD